MRIRLIAFAAIALLLAGTMAVLAGTVGGRQVVTLSTTAGTAEWVNPYQYASVKLHRVSIASNLNATNQVTASRIITESTGTYTNAIGTVTAASGVGTQTTLAYSTLLYGDKLVFSSLVATGGVVVVEYDVSKH